MGNSVTKRLPEAETNFPLYICPQLKLLSFVSKLLMQGNDESPIYREKLHAPCSLSNKIANDTHNNMMSLFLSHKDAQRCCKRRAICHFLRIQIENVSKEKAYKKLKEKKNDDGNNL